jgi:hypothetical protein
MMVRIWSAVFVTALVAGCTSASPPADAPATAAPLTEIDAPAATDVAAPRLSSAADGRVFLTWLEPSPGGRHAFRFVVRTPGSPWSAPRTIAEGRDFYVSAADAPSLIVLDDGTLVAHWSARHVTGTEAAHIMLARSTDEGASWSAAVTPYRDRSKQQHGFVSLVQAPDRGTHVMWLDGRRTQGEGHGDMALMHTIVAAGGRVGTERTIDPRACDCCQTAAIATADGVLLAYRDRTDQEVRDIAVTRFDGARWSAPTTIADDRWLIFGCPVNGPSLSASGSHVALAWFTEALERPHVSIVLSHDGGRTFGRPAEVSGEKSLGRVQAVALPDGGALVSWVESVELGTEVRLRYVAADGRPGTSMTIAPAGVRSIPAMTYAKDEVALAWLDDGSPARLRTATLKAVDVAGRPSP